MFLLPAGLMSIFLWHMSCWHDSFERRLNTAFTVPILVRIMSEVASAGTVPALTHFSLEQPEENKAMSVQPFSPVNPVQPSDFTRSDIPAETDDLELGKRKPDMSGPIENAGSDPASYARRTGGSPDDPHGGQQ
jgi:hypothetical protein